MFLLDTDHVSHLQYQTSQSQTLRDKILVVSGDVVTSVITLEEQSSSWIARLGRERDVAKQVAIYQRINRMFDFFADWTVIDFTMRRRSDSRACDTAKFASAPAI